MTRTFRNVTAILTIQDANGTQTTRVKMRKFTMKQCASIEASRFGAIGVLDW